MATIQSSLKLYDGITPVLRKITKAMNIAISSFEDMEKASSKPFDTAQLHEARKQLVEVESDFIQIEEAAKKAAKQEERLNDNIRKGRDETNKLKEAWDKVSGTLGMAGIALGAKELLSGANNRRAAGNTLQGQTGMQGDTLEAAKQSMKTLYTDNMGASLDDIARSMSTVYQITDRTGTGLEQMTRAGLLLRDTFEFDITESIRTAEMMEKQFGMSGAQAFDMIVQGAQAGLNKNGDLLDTINEYSVQFRKLGFDSTDMFNMLVNGAKSGTFSVDKLGDTIKEFSIRAIDESKTTQEGFKAIGLDANKMAVAFGRGGESAKQAFQQTIDAISSVEDPVKRNIAGVNLFGTMWEDLGYEGVMALTNMNGGIELTTKNLEALNSVKYDDAGSALASLGRTINMGLSGVVGSAVDSTKRHIDNFTAGLEGDISQVQGIFGGIGFAAGIVGRAISDNWSIIEPIIWGVIAALVVYNATMGIAWFTTLKDAGAKIIAAAASAAAAIATKAHMIATEGLNAALLSCPITWIIIGIIALIAVFYGAVAIVNKFAGTSVSATGIIGAVFGVMAANIYNAFVYIWNIVAAFVNFFYNVWNDPVAAVQILFYDLASNVIACVINMAKAIESVINKIPGFEVSITAGLENFQSKIESAAAKVKSESEWKELVKTKEFLDYGDAAKTGYEIGKGAEKKIGSVFDGISNPYNGAGAMQDTWDGIHSNTGDTAGNTAAMADSMEMAEEELKSMRDMAEQEVINRFTTAELTVNMGGVTNQVNSSMDLDGIGQYMEDTIFEVLETAAEGVY